MLESSESPRHPVLCVPSAGKLREVGNPLEAPAPCLLSRGLPAAVIYSPSLCSAGKHELQRQQQWLFMCVGWTDGPGDDAKAPGCGWLWLPPVKEGSRSRQRLLPWPF